MTTSDISGHLLADWVPSLPVVVGSSFIGWPPHLLRVDQKGFLVIRGEVGHSERQWKGFLSWMLGIAGARHVLASEGYRWIAPVSAFYSDFVQTVDLSKWNPAFPPSVLSTGRRPGSRSRFCPDYLALQSITLRQRGTAYQWAVAEAKGTRRCLKNTQTCPPEWAKQVRNIVVKLAGSTLTIPRYLVVATRVHPTAASVRARRLQLRAWNRKEEAEDLDLPPEAAVEIAAANLFGLFKGLRLPANANAIAFSVRTRTTRGENRLRDWTLYDRDLLAKTADEELRAQTQKRDTISDAPAAALLSVRTELGDVDVALAEPLITFARELLQAKGPDEAALALQKADLHLDVWQSSRQTAQTRDRKIVLPLGVELLFPNEFEAR